MSLKKANLLLRSNKLYEAKEIYKKLYKNSNSLLREQISFNLSIIDKKVKFISERKALDDYYFSDSSVFVGIASIPSREYALKKTIESLQGQVDKIGVFLDGYTDIPSFLEKNENVVIKKSSDFSRKVGDAGKFLWVEQHQGYYFTCDDDLIYPEDFIVRIKEKIQSIAEPVVVGWHGSLILKPFDNYYDKSSRRVFTFGSARPEDTPVHILGTGCLGFHTSDIKVKFEDFLTPNMADVYFARLAQEQNVPLMVIEHKKSEIKEVENTRDVSIYKHSHEDKDTFHNTKARQNEIVSSINWKVNYIRKSLKVLIIGRFLINKKGGIYKSSNLLAEALTSLGHRVTTCCLSQIDDFDFFSEKYDFSIVYAPDPERPDFSNCITKVQELLNYGTVCAVNFSFNLNQERTKWISKQLENLNSQFDNPRCFFASFSNSTAAYFEANIRTMIVPFPKTISLNFETDRKLKFHEREGIFLGDLAKILDNRLTHGSIISWIEAIKKRLPHVNIYAIKHYHTALKYPQSITVLPYTPEIERVLSKHRICINLTPGATFEMVPLESLLSGTPVLHRNMPQSLSEYLSPVSIEVNSPEELAEACKNIYEDERIWQKLSDAGSEAYSFFKVENISASLELAMRKCITRAGL